MEATQSIDPPADESSWWRAFLPFATFLVGVLTGIFGVWQYIANSASAQTKESLSYVEHFYNPPFSDSMNRIFGTFLKDDSVAKAGSDPIRVSTAIENLVKANGLYPDIIIEMNFFEDLYACTCSGLCDATVVHNFFGKPSINLWQTLAPYVELRRKGDVEFADAPFGQGLERMFKAVSATKNQGADFGAAYCANSGLGLDPVASIKWKVAHWVGIKTGAPSSGKP